MRVVFYLGINIYLPFPLLSNPSTYLLTYLTYLPTLPYLGTYLASTPHAPSNFKHQTSTPHYPLLYLLTSSLFPNPNPNPPHPPPSEEMKFMLCGAFILRGLFFLLGVR
jgi:hypothetical protein